MSTKPKIHIASDGIGVTSKNFKAFANSKTFIATHGDKEYTCEATKLDRQARPTKVLILGMAWILHDKIR